MGAGFALVLLDARSAPADLVVTDLVMPQMGGKELGEELGRRWPDLPVLYMWGYTDDDVVLRGLVRVDAPFVARPFTPDLLAR